MRSPPAQMAATSSRITKRVAVTPAATSAVTGLVFFLIHQCSASRRKEKTAKNAGAAAPRGDRRVVPQGNVVGRIDGNVRGLIVDENGLDACLGNLERRKSKLKEEEDDDAGNDEDIIAMKKSKSVQAVILPVRGSPLQSSTQPPHLLPPGPSPTTSLSDIQKPGRRSPPPPPPSPYRKSSAPASPPIPARKSPALSLPPLKAGITKPSSKPPPTPSGTPGTTSKNEKLSGDSTSESGNDQLKLKPLHLHKVNTNNIDQSMVWDKIDRGSLRADHDLVKALFGYAATNRRSRKGKNHSISSSSVAAEPSNQTFLLDPRKSQNIAIVLKSENIASESQESRGAMHLVKRTDYYQGVALKDTTDNTLLIFVIVTDFLGMVDQTCIEIAHNLQQKKKDKIFIFQTKRRERAADPNREGTGTRTFISYFSGGTYTINNYQAVNVYRNIYGDPTATLRGSDDSSEEEEDDGIWFTDPLYRIPVRVRRFGLICYVHPDRYNSKEEFQERIMHVFTLFTYMVLNGLPSYIPHTVEYSDRFKVPIQIANLTYDQIKSRLARVTIECNNITVRYPSSSNGNGN